MRVDFSSLRKTRPPTRRERGLYHRWVKYLSDSKLDEDTIHERAASYAALNRCPPNETG